MIFHFPSNRRTAAAMTAGLLSATVAAAAPVMAGPTLETRENTSIGAQATFNNSWAQTFEAKGSMTVPSTGNLLIPFQSVQGDSLVLPTSGLAELTATVSNLTVRGGDLDASSSVNPTQLVGGGSNSNPNANNIVLNGDTTNGLPALVITPGTPDSSVIGASIIGTNIGTQSLQVTGSLGTTVINTLTAF